MKKINWEKEKRMKALVLLIGTPPPYPPYPYPPVELLVDYSDKAYKKWKKEMEENGMRYKTQVKQWEILRANELKKYRRLIKGKQ